ncbi:hypothetical protein AX16_010791 [Volvariella volvacea WC 439]|nr:hypothetical protein AX16_010791 [Volvariella volvacea WC 439]
MSPLRLHPPKISSVSQQSADFFNHATIHNSNGTIIANSGTWTTVHNHHTSWIPVYGAQVPPRERLRALVVRDAMHTGKVRADPLECAPNTRQAILEDITLWIEDNGRKRYILWLRGPAGIGKSAIAKTIAGRLDQRNSKAKVAGSFFFFRGDSQRNSLSHFVPTIAYRLAVTFQEVGDVIDGVVGDDLEILDADVSVQWRKLVVEPVMTVPGISPSAFIIDGLDECGDEKDQRKLLDLIASCGPHFPIAFLITSRPEPHIVNSFGADPLLQLCRPTIDLARCTSDWEMTLFIRSRFSQIYTRHRDILQCYSINGVWPSPHIVNLIATRANGQYIYPVILFKYIDEDYSNPHERLQACLEQAPEALSSLDALYMQIMQSSHEPSNHQIQDLLFLIITPSLLEPLPSKTFRRLYGPSPLESWSTILGLSTISSTDSAECRLKLRRLHSLINIPNQDDREIGLHHKSFADFLVDPTRSCQYYINRSDCAMRVIEMCLMVLEREEKDVDIRHILRCWWRCAMFVSYEDISPSLVSRMERIDIPQVLWDIKAFDRMREAEPLQADYEAFVAICRTWVNCGRRAGEAHIAEVWDNMTVLERFPMEAFTNAFTARQLREFFTRSEIDWDVSCVQAGDSAEVADKPYPLSWKGLLVLAEPFNEKQGVWVWIDDSDVVWATLKVFAEERLVRKLSAEDLEYLRTWSRPWITYIERKRRCGTALVSWSYDTPTASEIVQLLKELPAEYHFHKLNRGAMLLWLKTVFDGEDSGVEGVIGHWEMEECRSAVLDASGISDSVSSLCLSCPQLLAGTSFED